LDVKVLPNFPHGGMLAQTTTAIAARWCCRGAVSA
jgi:hypothetical protein